MKFVDEFRNKKLILEAAKRIKKIIPASRGINIMEVCGTHTQNFCRFGLGKLLPENLHFISGPGCPVCVSPQSYIDSAIELARRKDVLIVTFGDMLRIPGTNSSLEKENSRYGNVQIVYSALDALRIARHNPERKIIFLAVGFETTAPTIALSILSAKKERLKNIFFFSALKLIPAAMDYLMRDKRLCLSGFLCPGHVSAIIGTKDYEFIPKRYKIGCCVAGFEPLDIMEGIYLLVRQIADRDPQVQNQYSRVVRRRGNLRARRIIREVFRVQDSSWRGLGIIPQSGLSIRKEFSGFDAGKAFNIKLKAGSGKLTAKCRCGDILKGLIRPTECRLFAKVCLPDNPVGPCMVSHEGACNAYYRYRR